MGFLWQYSRLPRVTSYCVELTLRRLCSTQPEQSHKAKHGKKPDSNGKKQSSSTDAPAEGEEALAKKRTKKAQGDGEKKTQAEQLAEHVAREPASAQNLISQYDDQLNRLKYDPHIFYIINESIAGK